MYSRKKSSSDNFKCPLDAVVIKADISRLKVMFTANAYLMGDEVQRREI
jgi:hypothetical protein